MDASVWGSTGQNALGFMVAVAFFGAGTALMGTWVERHGPFASAVRTLVLVPAGWALIGLAGYVANYPLLMIGCLLLGSGISVSYIGATSMLQRQFRESKGAVGCVGVRERGGSACVGS